MDLRLRKRKTKESLIALKSVDSDVTKR